MKGRPRKFDIDKALESAMLVFWRNGYEGSSLSELTAAMKINRPSLYGTFGDKEQLFYQAWDRYLADYGTKGIRKLSEHSDVKEAIAAFLNCTVEQQTDSALPSGCLIANSTLESGSNKFEGISRRLDRYLTETETVICERLKLAQAEGQISKTHDLQALARFFTMTMMGMAVMARTNRDPEAIGQLAKTALKVLSDVSIN